MVDFGEIVAWSWRRGRRFSVGLGVAASSLVLALVCAGASWGASGYDPSLDVNSMFNTTLYTGAQAWWNAGYTGQGVDVAVIDTGVSPVAGSRRARQGRSTALTSRSSRRRRT